MIILGGIVAGIPGAIGRTVEHGTNNGPCRASTAIGLIVVVLGGDRVLRVVEARAVSHPGRLRRATGRPPHDGRAVPHLPFKLNMSGVEFRRSSPRACCCSRRPSRAWWCEQRELVGPGAAGHVLAPLGYGQPLPHIAVYALPDHLLLLLRDGAGIQRGETADNLKKSAPSTAASARTADRRRHRRRCSRGSPRPARCTSPRSCPLSEIYAAMGGSVPLSRSKAAPRC